LRRLLDYARAFDLAVLVTNQVHAAPVAVSMYESRPEILNPPTGGHVFCLHPSTLVCTLDYGVVPVSKVHNPVMLLSGEQEVGICDGVRRSRPNIALRINEELECSPEHRLLKFDNGRIVPCQAKDIKVGDWLVVARRIDYSVEKDVRLPEIQVEYVYKILNGNEVKQKLKAKGLSLKRREHVERLGVKPRHLRRILNQQYPTKLHVIKAIEQFIGSEVSYKKVVTKKHRDIQIPTYLTPELAQIFGYWLGDGSTLHRNSVLLADERLEVLQHYAALLRKVFNLNSRIIKSHKNCYKLVCNSRHAMKILNWLLGNLNLLPQAKKEVVRGFLRGIFDAEGCGDYRWVKMSNIYDGPVLYTKICLLRFGIFSTIKREMQTNISGRTIAPFVLEITSSNVDKFYAEIGFTSPSKAIGRTNVKRRTPQKYRFLSEHLAIRRVDSIKEVPTDDVFIDISVKPTETFLANGYVVHNSYAVNSHLYMNRTAKQAVFLAVLIDSSYMPRGEARYMITEKGISNVEVKKGERE
jgi:intein/homing endonuclease